MGSLVGLAAGVADDAGVPDAIVVVPVGGGAERSEVRPSRPDHPRHAGGVAAGKTGMLRWQTVGM